MTQRTRVKGYVSAALAVVLLIATPHAWAGNGGTVDLWLTVLHNNDGESQLVNAGTGLADYGGVARFKTVVDALRTQAVVPRRAADGARRGVIVLASGDNYLAGPEFSASLANGVPFYDSIVMNLVGYDALAIGNHEFDFGPDVFADFILGLRPRLRCISANLDFSNEPRLDRLVRRHRLAASHIALVRGHRIGIIGVTTDELPFISSPRRVTVDPDIAGAVMHEVAYLQSRAVNKIIVFGQLQGLATDLALIPMLSDVDLYISGGGQELLANPNDVLIPGEGAPFGPYPLFGTDAQGRSVPVVTTNGDYRYVGRLVVGFDAGGHVLVVDAAQSGPVRVSGVAPDAVAPDPVMQAQVVAPVQAYTAALGANVIGVSEVPLDGRRSPGVRTRETNLGDLVADALLWAARQRAAAFGVAAPTVAFQNGGGIRNNNVIPAGNLTELTTFDVLPFANFVSVVEDVSREQIKVLIENAVAAMPTANGKFAQVAGLRFAYTTAGTAQVLNADLTVATPGTRVQDVVLDDGTVIVAGGSVVPGDPIDVATIDFLARGGDQYPFNAPFTTVGVTYQQALRNYIETGLAGAVTAAEYPESGEGRITLLP